MTKTTGSGHPLVKSLLTGFVMAMLMSATAFAATTPPIRSGTYKTPTRSGYEFQGWYDADDPDKTIVIDKNGNWLTDFSEDTRVKAKWEQPPTVLLPGEQFNTRLKRLAGPVTASWSGENTTITGFQKATSAPDVSTMTSSNLISTAESAYPVYAWFDNGTIWWYSDAEFIEMNPICYHMFYKFIGLTTLDLSMFNTANVTNMSSLFFDCSSLTSLDISGWDTSNVTNMGAMFSGCEELTTLDLSGFDTSQVTGMGNMFNMCRKLTNLNISSFDTSKVTNMSSMFYGCIKLTDLDLSGWNTSAVQNMNRMFMSCIELSTIYASELWNTSSVTDSTYMFYQCTSLPNFYSSYVDKSRAHYGTGGYLTYKAAPTTP